MPLIQNALIAGILVFALGWAWYGPLFGKNWMTATGKKPEDCAGKKPPLDAMGASAAAALLGAWIYGWLYYNMPQTGSLFFAVELAVLLWAAFFLTQRTSGVLWNGQNKNLIWIDSGYQLAGLLIYAVVFGVL
ncbi:MAG: DUF1761 domain-containing protein [Alphaproteobacteria bacterium]|nr:DUF1761 domain-containing protein [Alphaproteobacteria bacterium]